MVVGLGAIVGVSSIGAHEGNTVSFIFGLVWSGILMLILRDLIVAFAPSVADKPGFACTPTRALYSNRAMEADGTRHEVHARTRAWHCSRVCALAINGPLSTDYWVAVLCVCPLIAYLSVRYMHSVSMLYSTVFVGAYGLATCIAALVPLLGGVALPAYLLICLFGASVLVRATPNRLAAFAARKFQVVAQSTARGATLP